MPMPRRPHIRLGRIVYAAAAFVPLVIYGRLRLLSYWVGVGGERGGGVGKCQPAHRQLHYRIRRIAKCIASVRLKGVSFTKDAAKANEAMVAQEHYDIACSNAANRSASVDDTTVSIGLDCVHHQAALIKKPCILDMSGLASTLVRMAHVHQVHSFTEKFEAAMDHYADHVVPGIQFIIDRRASRATD
jgi:hypothetical protein